MKSSLRKTHYKPNDAQYQEAPQSLNKKVCELESLF